MKTVYDSNPEFSLTYKHGGVQVTLSGKVLTQDYLSIAGSDQENEALLGTLSCNSLPEVARQAAIQLTKFHSEFGAALAASLTPDVYQSFSPPDLSPCNQCGSIIAKRKD